MEAKSRDERHRRKRKPPRRARSARGGSSTGPRRWVESTWRHFVRNRRSCERGVNHDMYQRKNTPSISTLQYCQHTREYLKEARTGNGTTGSVLGTSPFPRKPVGHPRPAPNTQHRKGTNSHKARTQTHRPTTKGRRQQKGNHLGNQESVVVLIWTLRPTESRGVSDQLRFSLRDAVSQTN